jgi:hypothetical protein
MTNETEARSGIFAAVARAILGFRGKPHIAGHICRRQARRRKQRKEDHGDDDERIVLTKRAS